MKKTKSNALFSLFVLLILGTVGYLLYLYFFLPQKLIEALGLDVSLFVGIQHELLPMLILGFLMFAFSMSLITFLFIERQKAITQEIIYIEKFIEQGKEEQAKKREKSIKLDEKVPLLKEELSNTVSQKRFQLAINHLCNLTQASAGAFFIAKKEETHHYVELSAAYAYPISEGKTLRFEYGDGLVGQVAKDRKITQISSVPKGYIQILSGLGQALPSHLLLVPVKNKKDELLAVVEIAGFKKFSKNQIAFIEEIGSYVFSI